MWRAIVEEKSGVFDWDIDVADEEAARRWLPIYVPPGARYTQAWHVARDPGDRDLTDQSAIEALRSGEPRYRQEFRMMLADGSQRWVAEDVEIESLGAHRWHLVGVMSDVTDRKLAEQSLADSVKRLEEQCRRAEHARTEARAVLDASTDAILLITRQGRVLMRNRAADYLLETSDTGDEREDSSGRLGPLERAFGAAAAERIGELIADASSQCELALAQSWPDERAFSLFSAPVRTSAGDLLGRLFVFRDVTRAREIERMKSDLVSLVSHELRTPLTSIKGYVDLIIDGEVGDVVPEQLEFLTVIKRNADRLTALTNDLLDTARVEAGHVELQRQQVDVASLIRLVATSLRPQVEAKGQSLKVSVPGDLPPVLGDGDRLTQVLTNLVSNAHKYTSAGGYIELTAEASGRDVLINVRDNGIGLTIDEQSHLFERFFRASNEAVQSVSGTGLGLAITKSLVERHGGSISVKSAVGAGSTFTVRLPICHSSVEAADETLVDGSPSVARRGPGHAAPVRAPLRDDLSPDAVADHVLVPLSA
jgi:signal transduction histidine kinase